MKNVVIIGAGFSGLSAAAFMAKAGWKVTVIEQHVTPGGRARQLKEQGFTFDMGPSWYWMPDVFERFFQQFNKKVGDYYQLQRLDPSYRIYWPDSLTDLPANYDSFCKVFEDIEHGSADRLDAFLKEAAYKYETGMHNLVFKPGRSLFEFADTDLIKGMFKLDVFASMKKHIARFFKNEKLRQLLSFPVLFLGAMPEHIPALYSLMNYADIKLGTWYPQGGMYKIVEAMQQLCEELGVQFYFGHKVLQLPIEDDKINELVVENIIDKKQHHFNADVVIAGADYHFVEANLLPLSHRSYTEDYWQKKIMAPSCILYYIGINKRIKGLQHHSLFFDTNFETHGKEIYETPAWPSDPMFYVSAVSVTDKNAAPEGCENLFFLIPVAAGLQNDIQELREKYFQQVIKRFEERVGEPITSAIVYKKSYAISDFLNDYNSYKGNAYGLANTLLQTAVLKPGIKSKKVKNLYYTGQLTVPGPGVPPSLISGEVVAKEVIKNFG